MVSPPYELDRGVVGYTSMGTLKRGRCVSTGKDVSVLVVGTDKLSGGNAACRILKSELRILHSVGNHPSICGVKEMLHTKKGLYIIQPSWERDTFQEMESQPLKRLSESSARDFLGQVLSGLGHMHKLGVCHRCLKPETVLLDANNKVLLSGLAFATLAASTPTTSFTLSPTKYSTSPSHSAAVTVPLSQACGSLNYTAPEVIYSSASHTYDGRISDIWSLGCMLYCWCAGFTPFDDVNGVVQLFSDIHKGIFAWPKWFSMPLRDLISRMLVVDPSSRMTIHDIRHHPWLQKQETSTSRRIRFSPSTACLKPVLPSTESKLRLCSPCFCTDIETSDYSEHTQTEGTHTTTEGTNSSKYTSTGSPSSCESDDGCNYGSDYGAGSSLRSVSTAASESEEGMCSPQCI